jgi:hypothetical protein
MAVYGYTLLLWELTKSGAFRHHMALLADAKLLNLPRYDDLGAYLSFAGEYGVPWDDKTDKASKIAEAEAKATAMRKVIAATRRAMSKIGLGWPKRNGRGNGEGEGEGEKEGEELPEATPTPTNVIDDADTEEGNAEKGDGVSWPTNQGQELGGCIPEICRYACLLLRRSFHFVAILRIFGRPRTG